MARCPHPKAFRQLEHGYDIVCSRCGDMIGRVALFPCVVLPANEASALLDALTREDTMPSAAAREAHRKLELAGRGGAQL